LNPLNCLDKFNVTFLKNIGIVLLYKLFDINGNEKESLFYHQHAVELIAENQFILYDNDYLNTTRENPEVGTPRLIIIEIDESTMEAHEIWSYTAPAEYYAPPETC